MLIILFASSSFRMPANFRIGFFFFGDVTIFHPNIPALFALSFASFLK